jgi:hypothetical protein
MSSKEKAKLLNFSTQSGNCLQLEFAPFEKARPARRRLVRQQDVHPPQQRECASRPVDSTVQPVDSNVHPPQKRSQTEPVTAGGEGHAAKFQNVDNPNPPEHDIRGRASDAQHFAQSSDDNPDANRVPGAIPKSLSFPPCFIMGSLQDPRRRQLGTLD